MLTLAALQTQLDALVSAYNSGTVRASYDGKSVEYRDASELRAAIAALENQINALTGASAPPRSILVRSRKGF